jgi:hypothetical protein
MTIVYFVVLYRSWVMVVAVIDGRTTAIKNGSTFKNTIKLIPTG